MADILCRLDPVRKLVAGLEHLPGLRLKPRPLDGTVDSPSAPVVVELVHPRPREVPGLLPYLVLLAHDRVYLIASKLRVCASGSFGPERETLSVLSMGTPTIRNRPNNVVASVYDVRGQRGMIGVDRIGDIRKRARGGESIASIARGSARRSRRPGSAPG